MGLRKTLEPLGGIDWEGGGIHGKNIGAGFGCGLRCKTARKLRHGIVMG